MDELKVLQAEIDSFLDRYFRSRAEQAYKLHKPYGELWENMNQVQGNGGKRLRPCLAAFVYESYGGQSRQNLLPVFSALELLHTAMLVHDDIIDRDDMRRNQPNLSGIYKQKYQQQAVAEQVRHYAMSAALMGGDLFLAEAYNLINQTKLPGDLNHRVTNLIAETVYHVIGGEFVDTVSVMSPSSEVDSLHIAAQKTAIYSFSTPFKLGAMLAAAETDQLELLEKLGIELGIAFQLDNDLIGVFGPDYGIDNDEIGDVREGKRTYLLQQTYAAANREQLKLLNEIVGNPECDTKMAGTVKVIMEETGAKTKAIDLIQQKIAQAQKIVLELNISKYRRDIFKNVINDAIANR